VDFFENGVHWFEACPWLKLEHHLQDSVSLDNNELVCLVDDEEAIDESKETTLYATGLYPSAKGRGSLHLYPSQIW
jgi:hypothetical protein